MAKLGAGHAAGMARLRLAELRNALNPSRESVADRDMGVFGNATQGEIASARGGPGNGPEQEAMSMDDLKSYAKDRAKEAEKAMDGRERQQVREIER